jgi:predicted glycosyltransferase
MYDILYSFTDAEIALQKALEILKNPESKKIWAEKRDRVFREKIDVTALMVSFMENYPRSFFEMKNHQKEVDA